MSLHDSTFDSIRPNNELGHGSITLKIQQAATGNEDAQQVLFVAVMDELKASARRIIKQFPRIKSLDADMLVNDIYETLLGILISKQFENREHFFAIACKNFRWTLLDIVNEKTIETEPLIGDHDSEDGRQDEFENEEFYRFALKYLDDIDPELAMIVDRHLVLGMSYTEISGQTGIARSTVHERFNKATQLLKKLFTD